MRFSVLFSCCLLGFITATTYIPIWYKGVTVPYNVLDGLKYIGWDIVQTLTKHDFCLPDTNCHINELEDLCHVTFCHNTNKYSCAKVCARFASRMDYEITDNRIRLNNSTEPVKDLEQCNQRCQGVCGKNDCREDCAVLCAIHFSYENRKEYEIEFATLLVRIFRQGDNATATN